MAQFEVRLVNRPNRNELHVWDTYRDKIANDFYGRPAVFYSSHKYTWDEASQWASNWAGMLNTHGYVRGITVNDQTGRGRPRRDPACPRGTAQYTRTTKPKNSPTKATPAPTTPAPTTPAPTTPANEPTTPTPPAPLSPLDAKIKALETQPLSTNDDKIDIDPEEMERIIRAAVDVAAGNVSRRLDNEIAGKALELVEWLDTVKEEIKAYKNITITTNRGVTTLKGRNHERLPKLLKAINAGVSPMLVGTAGTGKTTAAEKVAEALELPFYAISVSSQSTKSDLFGFIDVGGTYRETVFRKAYENGGVFLLDEIDAGNPNVLVATNAALSGKWAAFPDGMVARHENFVCITAANTFGNGASRQFVGRNQLDAATLDRFTMFTWDVDEALERSLIEHLSHGTRWHDAMKAARRVAQASNMHVIVSPRATMKGANLLEEEFTFDEVLDMTILHSADASQKISLRSAAREAWNAHVA